MTEETKTAKKKVYIMNLNLHFEDIIENVFRILVNSSADIEKDTLNSLLTNLIVTMKNATKKLRNILFEIEQNPEILLNTNLDDFYDNILELEDNFEQLLRLAEDHKDKSDMFMQFYKTINELYEITVCVYSDIGFIEAKLMHKTKTAKATL